MLLGTTKVVVRDVPHCLHISCLEFCVFHASLQYLDGEYSVLSDLARVTSHPMKRIHRSTKLPRKESPFGGNCFNREMASQD